MQRECGGVRRAMKGFRGFTLIEALTGVLAAVVLFSMALTVVSARGGAADAHFKLAQLGQAHACYAGDWNDRQWTALPYHAGQFGNSCSAYQAQLACAPQQFLGWDRNGAMWGFFSGSGGKCAQFGYPGNCGNWVVYVPLDFTTPGAPGFFNDGYGAFRLPNTCGFRQYISQAFYSPEWYSEDDPMYALASSHFDTDYEFTYNPSTGNFAEPSYCLSPAAMWNTGVMRSQSEGGFQNPSVLPECHAAPSTTQCIYPSLKTRMCEYGWFRNAPEEGLGFTGGLAAEPVTLFFDGSVAAIRMQDASEQDLKIYENSPDRDGLWHRGTTFLKDGWRLNGRPSIDGSASGFHVLTTGGILGRDLLFRDGTGGDR